MNRLTRLRETGSSTLGVLTIYKDQSEHNFCTLEPTRLFNLPFVSCIPEGTYRVKKRTSAKYGDHFHVTDVKNRSMILIHALNFYKDSEGCIGVGGRFKYLDGDGIYDVVNSRDTLDKILSLTPDEWFLEVVRHEHFQSPF